MAEAIGSGRPESTTAPKRDTRSVIHGPGESPPAMGNATRGPLGEVEFDEDRAYGATTMARSGFSCRAIASAPRPPALPCAIHATMVVPPFSRLFSAIAIASRDPKARETPEPIRRSHESDPRS